MLGLARAQTKRGPKGPLSGSTESWGGLRAQGRRLDRGEDAERQQVEGSDPVEVLHQGHDTHLEFQFWGTPWGAGAVRLDKLWIPESERCIDQRFRTAALRFRTCEICLSRAETAARAAGRPNLSAAMARQRRFNQPQTHANRHERALPTGIGSPGAARLRTGRCLSTPAARSCPFARVRGSK